MKSGKTIALSLALCLAFAATSWGASINWTSLEAAKDSAKNGDKIVYLHFYTDWCGWCKKLDTTTFKDPKVVSYMNKHFLAVRLNPEKSKTAKETTKQYGVQGFPAHGFTEDGIKPLGVLSGYMPPERFLTLLEYLGSDSYKTMTLDDYTKKKK